MEKVQVLVIDKYERGTIINALNEFRNQLLKQEISTDSVDELLLKIIRSPMKKKTIFRGLRENAR